MIVGATELARAAVATLAIAGLAILAFRRLRAAHYAPHYSFAISGCCVLPPAWFCIATPPIAFLALSTYAIGATATELAKNGDPRRIIQLGGALATGQILAPLSGTIAALLLPFALRIPQARHTPLQMTGLYLLILFIPAMTALTIVLLWPEAAAFSPALPAGDGTASPYEFMGALVFGAVPVVPAIAYSVWKPGGGGRVIASSLFAVLVGSYAVAGWLGEPRQARLVMAGLMPLSVLALTETPAKTSKPPPLEFAAAFILLVSCGLAFLAEKFSSA